MMILESYCCCEHTTCCILSWKIQVDTKKKWELLKNPTKIKAIQEKKCIDRN